MTSATDRPATIDSACSRPSATSSRSSSPDTRNFSCIQMKSRTCDTEKKRWRTRPRAKRRIDAPWMRVLSTSKNAAAPASWGMRGSGVLRRFVPPAASRAPPTVRRPVRSSWPSTPYVRARRPKEASSVE
ncbi:hypothetical protein ACFWIG_05885 [Corynebacterium bovis]|uniref:hypothetical protein n=1 Tax=Corynebacterium bovis TaxID=36808 RepID=UPI0036C24E4D